MTAIPAPPRPLPRWRQLVLRVATAAWRLLHSQPPAGDPLEEWLAAVEAELWPGDEYADDPPEGGR
jgi:hypothetical protein